MWTTLTVSLRDCRLNCRETNIGVIMIGKLLMAQTMFMLAAAGQPLACLPSQPVEAVEGGSATLQCRLDPPIDLSSKTLEWNRGHTLYVHVYRSRRDDPELQMLQYRDRTTLNHGDLSRGVSTLTISNVSLSDNGSYEVYLPQLEVRCSTHLTVEKEQSERKDSGTPAPPAEGDPAAEQRNHVLGVLILAFVAVVIAVWILVERGVSPICKKEGEPKTSEGDQQSAAEEGLVGSEVTDSNNPPSHTVY